MRLTALLLVLNSRSLSNILFLYSSCILETAAYQILAAYRSCPPLEDLGIVLELQTSNTNPESTRTRAWLKTFIFTPSQLLKSGAWKVPLRHIPIRPNASPSELETLPLYGHAAIYIRIVNHWDTELQSQTSISPSNYIDYAYPRSE